ncbi:threonylcarbamoyl-AMP synthase [Candidatus Pacearchaeota archaeon]|nr:threonylcarbamoyl-AMP synthase [Candidatus Pacearchaeota archaeon]|tara:strand:- start:393 stop:902 length:510 start_codon:yes stop_codon:yes gene_type:complete
MNTTNEIISGKIFIYPTDTVYGIGCDATNQDSVKKIKEIKGRDKDKPLSIIAPSLKWINENLIVDVDLSKYLPGPYTLILKKKDPEFLKHIAPGDSLGIRIPKTELTNEIQKSRRPFVTTSLNLSGNPPITSIDKIPNEIKNKVDHIIDGGELNGRPSTLIINGKEIKR